MHKKTIHSLILLSSLIFNTSTIQAAEYYSTNTYVMSNNSTENNTEHNFIIFNNNTENKVNFFTSIPGYENINTNTNEPIKKIDLSQKKDIFLYKVTMTNKDNKTIPCSVRNWIFRSMPEKLEKEFTWYVEVIQKNKNCCKILISDLAYYSKKLDL